MDYYGYFWGLLKYYIPAILLIISLTVEKSFLLLTISIVWISASLFVVMLLQDEDKGQRR